MRNSRSSKFKYQSLNQTQSSKLKNFSHLNLIWHLKFGICHFRVVGFTLIELLITIAVIGALASIGLISFTGQQKSARDTQRKSDLQQYRIALENYSNANSSTYPTGTDTAVNNLCASGAALSNFMSGCPAGSPYSYQYTSDGTGSKYVMWVELERTGNNWVVCSGGKSGERTKTGFSAADGVCPI